MLRLIAVLASVMVVSQARAQDAPVVIRGGTILTGDGTVIEGGDLVFSGGKIDAVGTDIPAPPGASEIDASGQFVTPGYIDAYSHIGLDGRQRWTRESLMAPSRRLSLSLPPTAESEWLRAGTTTVYVSPGAENLVGGLGTIVKLTGAPLEEDAALSMSYGETALRTFAAPTTRQGMVGIVRQTLVNAQEDGIAGEDGRVFAQILFESLPTRMHVNTPDDILTALRLAVEFDLELILDAAAGAHVVAGDIASAGVPVVVGPTIVGLGDGGPYEGFAHTPANAAILAESGVAIAFGTGDAGRGRAVAMEALVAKAHGLSANDALVALTAGAATILGVSDRIGTLAPGKDADIVVWSEEPVTTWAETRVVIVDGETVFTR